MQFIRSKPVLPVEMAPKLRTARRKPAHLSKKVNTPIYCVLWIKKHSDQVSSGDQTSIDWDTDYIVQHANLIGTNQREVQC